MPTDGQRLEVLEDGMQRLWDILDAEERLSKRVHGLRDDVQGLSDVIKQVQQNRVELRTVGEGLREVRETATATRRHATRRISLLTLVVVLGIAGTVITGWWAHTARIAATQVLLVGRQECRSRDEGLREAVARETALAGTDVPATRAAHRHSAAVFAGQIRDCDALYPIPGR